MEEGSTPTLVSCSLSLAESRRLSASIPASTRRLRKRTCKCETEETVSYSRRGKKPWVAHREPVRVYQTRVDVLPPQLSDPAQGRTRAGTPLGNAVGSAVPESARCSSPGWTGRQSDDLKVSSAWVLSIAENLAIPRQSGLSI